MMDRFFKQHNLTLKKTYGSKKVVKPEVQQLQLDYWLRIRDVDADKLVFIDETGFWVGMMRAVERGLRGKKAYQLLTKLKKNSILTKPRQPIATMHLNL